jgi:DNA topoisomerase-1
VGHFEDIMNYKFTAKVENEFDNVAEGKVSWQNMIKDFYKEFNTKITEAEEAEIERTNSNELGVDPKTGKNVYAKIGKFGPYLQIGESTDEEKPEFVSLKKGTLISSITFEEALAIMNGPKLPLELGLFEGSALVVNEGRYGPYILHNGKYVNMDKGEDPLLMTKERAIELIENKRKDPGSALPREMKPYAGEDVIIGKGRFGVYIKHGAKYYNLDKALNPLEVTDEKVVELIEAQKAEAAKKIIREYPENANVKVLNGRYGPYIQIGKRNVKIPKDMEPESLTLEDCLKLGEG